MSEVVRERNDLEGAGRLLLESQELGEHAAMPQHPYRWRVAMARLRRAEGDAEEALALLEEAERFCVNDFFLEVRPLAALRARHVDRHGASTTSPWVGS
jgi:LuxR family maltose regulon positive regulatory protein